MGKQSGERLKRETATKRDERRGRLADREREEGSGAHGNWAFYVKQANKYGS